MKKIITLLGVFLVLFSYSTYGQLNYKFSAGSGTFTPLSGASAFTWTTTTANDEEYSSATNIGFTFNYAGTDYTQFQASTNGFIRFGTGLTSATSTDALDGKLRQIVAPLWDNLKVGATATDITYFLEGTTPNQVLTVEWKNVKWNSSATSVNAQFQVKLYEGSNKIEFVYGAMTQPGSVSASIGLADNTVITTAASATGKFLSINVAGTQGARVYHRSMGYTFNVIITPPDANTVLTFEPVTPTPIAGGTYTIGGTNPDYKSLSDAAMALNINGISGPVVLNVRDGSYDDIFHLIDVKGTSQTNTITLENESGTVILSPSNGTGSSTSGSAGSSDAIIRMDGTQYTTIQGLTLNNNNLTTIAAKYEIGVLLGNAALNGVMVKGGRFNHFKNLTVDMKATTGINHSGAIGFRYFTTGTTDTDTSLATSYNKIENCNITGFWRSGWKSYGVSVTNPDRGNVITGCTFGNVSIASGTGAADVRVMEIDAQANLLIEKNKIQNITSSIFTTNNIYGLWFNPGSSSTILSSGTITIRNNEIDSLYNNGTGVTTGVASAISVNNVANNTEVQIYGNKIYNLFSSCTGAGRAEGIYANMSAGTPVTVKIYNNMIYDLKAPKSNSTAPMVRGLALADAGGNGNFIVDNNTVYLDNLVTPAITATNAGYRSACLFLQSFTTGTLDLKNNLFVNKMGTSATGTGVSASSCFQTEASTIFPRMTASSDNNLFFADTTIANNGIAFDGTNVYKTMADYLAIASMGSRDANSVSVDPTASFVSAVRPYDMHISPNSWLEKAHGAPTSLVNTDIDGDVRSTDFATGPISIGADEYQPTGKPVVKVTGTIADGQTSTFTGVDGKTVGEITWHSGKGTLPDSVSFAYVPGGQLTTLAGASIFKNYSVSPYGGTKGWNADLKLYYNPTTELNGITEADLKMHQKTGETWSQLPAAIDLVKHFGKANVISFGDFTFGQTAPVPTVSIETAREDLNSDFVPDRKGQTFKITGVVVTGNFAISDTASSYYINDKTAGILLSAPKRFSTALTVGDSIQVTGVIDQYKGATEIVPADTVVGENGSIVVLKAHAAVPAPIVVTVNDLNSEKYEGNLVVVRGLTKMSSSASWPVANDTSLTVGVGKDSTSLFVDHDTDLKGSNEPEWPLDLTGVVGQNSTNLNDGYMLIPRSIADVTIPVLSLAKAREDLNNDFIPDRKGQILKAKGVVVSPDFTASAAGNNYYIMDGTAGVLLYSATKLSAALNIGDSISVKGKIDQYKGATEFVPVTTEVGAKGSVVVVQTGVKIPAPIEITIKDVNSEKYEGSLVKVKNVNKTVSSGLWPAAGKNANMRIGAESDSTILFIDLDTDIDGTAEVKWPNTITGVISQYSSSATPNDGYELIPRSIADFEIPALTGVADNSKIPATYALNQNYPNPFNPSTTISFDLKANANVTLKIFSVLGEEVATLANSNAMTAGHKNMSFNAANLPSGLYIYRLEAKGDDGSNFTGIKKMMLLK